MPTVVPLKTTAEPACCIAFSTACVVRRARLLAFLAPADDDQQRVVDRDSEPDQRDQELHDHGDVGDAVSGQIEQERRRDRDDRHQQRDDRGERAEDEDEHEQRAECGEQRPEEHARSRSLRVVAGCAERVEPGDPHACAADRDAGERLLREPRFRLALVDTATSPGCRRARRSCGRRRRRTPGRPSRHRRRSAPRAEPL